MEALTRLVADSLARHGLDRPVDPRRLQWSRWFRCDSPHSLLVVPSKPGIFALAEEVMDFGPAAVPVPCSSPEGTALISPGRKSGVNAHQGAESRRDGSNDSINFDATVSKRMLAVLQFSEDDDMAFTLDRMFTQINPMRARLSSGRCFLRFVVIEDQAQRRSICTALNQWMLNSAEKASGLPSDFQSSLELTACVGRAPSPANANTTRVQDREVSAELQTGPTETIIPAPSLDSGANKNLHCPHPLPSGF